MHTFYVTDDFKPIYEEYKKIAMREGRAVSDITRDLITDYVKIHASGNPSFELNKWIEQPEFVGDPAVREKNEKWDKYLSECDEKDLAQLQGTFQLREKQAREAWKKKKFSK